MLNLRRLFPEDQDTPLSEDADKANVITTVDDHFEYGAGPNDVKSTGNS